MDSGITTQDAGPESPGAEKALYVEPASLIDVMIEQLEYLFAHSSGACKPGCVECSRLAEVQHSLLKPFQPAAAVAADGEVVEEAA